VLLAATGRKYGSDTDVLPTGDAIFHGPIPWYVMLRQGKYKYVRPLIDGELEELYDLKADPEELKNLATDTEFSNTLSDFRSAAVAELKRTDAGFADRMPPVRSGVK
jgi:arylsulfatase A-like enzyme